MISRIITIAQSTSATKAMLFSEDCELLHRVNIEHQQFYPQIGWVEHDAEEIYKNTIEAIHCLLEQEEVSGKDISYSLAITNQRGTVVVWNKRTGKPVYHAVVWQCQRGAAICKELKDKGYSGLVQQKTGLLIDPYFSASGAKWILDNVENARELAEKGDLLMGTIDSWQIWTLLELFMIPRNMMPKALPCDSVFGETTIEGLFKSPIPIAGVLGDSHGALTGQMCFEAGMGKVTYGTGSSVMVNIGEEAVTAPEGLVTSVGFSALGKVYYAFEGNIHCTGATIKWMVEKLGLVDSFNQIETLATSVKNNDGVYLVPAFTGLGAPWWKPDAKAAIWGMTLNAGKAHVLRAGLESIAYQVKDLIDMMTRQAGIELKALRVVEGPTRNQFLMQFQADMLQAVINRSEIEEASALGAVVMNGFARGKWNRFQEAAAMRTIETR